MILFVDDEKMFNESYVEALVEAKYIVEFEQNIVRALDFFKSRRRELELVIMDIMFSLFGSIPPDIDESKIEGGLRVGEEVLRLMNDSPDGRKIPKIILTNVTAEDFHAKYASSENVVGCYKKRETLPSELVEIVKGILPR